MPLPLSEFPPEWRESILRAAHQMKAPPKWIDFGIAQIPSRASYEWNRLRRQERKRVRRLRIVVRDGWKCGICGLPVSWEDLEIDHIIPICKGGKSDPDNLQATHRNCNRLKGGN